MIPPCFTLPQVNGRQVRPLTVEIDKPWFFGVPLEDSEIKFNSDGLVRRNLRSVDRVDVIADGVDVLDPQGVGGWKDEKEEHQGRGKEKEKDQK